MSQLRRAKNLVKSSFRPPSPERAAPGVPLTSVSVGNPSEVPEGRTSSFEVRGLEVAVANVGGAYYAFNDICTHRRCPLSDGELDGTTLTCICHGSQFDITTGDVLRGPAQRPVEVYAAHVEGDELRVDVPLRD